MSQGVSLVTAVTGLCHRKVTHVTAVSPQILENKRSGSKASQPGCDFLYKKQIRIRKNQRKKKTWLALEGSPQAQGTANKSKSLGIRYFRLEMKLQDRANNQ
jgi:hypothetical protein